jgi:hypothetical protein
MDELSLLYNRIENAFDRAVYQRDGFFWLLMLTYFGLMIAMLWESLPESNALGTVVVVACFLFSWIYTNSRRRGLGIIAAFFTALACASTSPLGGFAYLWLRPPDVVVTALPPAKAIPFPVMIGGGAFMLNWIPFRILLKMSIWGMGIAFFIIGLTEL